MRRLATCAAAGLLLACAPAASGQSFDEADTLTDALAIALDPGTRLVRQTVAPLAIGGELVVDFRGRGETGTILVRPPARGQLFASETVDREGRREVAGFAALSQPFDVLPTAFARVRRTTPGGSRLCADAGAAEAVLQLGGSPGGVDVQLSTAGTGLLASGCSGPLAEDLAGALPVRRLTYAQLRSGPRTIDLQATRDFSAGGYTGTLRSSLVVRVGRGRTARPRPRRAERPSGGGLTLRARWRVASVTGRVAVDVRSTMAPALCEALDACGLAGTVTLKPRLVSGTGELYGPRRRPGAVPPLFGSASWRDAGRMVASLARPGEEPCADAVPLGEGSVSIQARAGAARLAYTPGARRTRCPGPDLPAVEALASATVPARSLGARRVTLRFTRPVTVSREGYTLTSRPDLAVVLERR